MKGFSQGFSKYALWFASTGFSAYIYLSFRSVSLILMQSLGWSHYLINFMDKMVMMVLGLAVIALILLIEHFYTEKGWVCFLLVTAIQIVLYTIVQFINLTLRKSLLAVDCLIFAGLIVISCILGYLYHRYKRNLSHGSAVK